MKDVLQNVTLDDLYKDKKIVGDTMSPGYVPKIFTPGETIKKINESKVLKSTIKGILSKK